MTIQTDEPGSDDPMANVASVHQELLVVVGDRLDAVRSVACQLPGFFGKYAGQAEANMLPCRSVRKCPWKLQTPTHARERSAFGDRCMLKPRTEQIYHQDSSFEVPPRLTF